MKSKLKHRKKVLSSLKRLINNKPSLFNEVCGVDMKKLSSKNRLKEIRECFNSGPVGKEKIASIVAKNANLIPSNPRKIQNLTDLHNRSVLEHVTRKETNLSHLKSTGFNLDPIDYGEVTDGSTPQSQGYQSLPSNDGSSDENKSNNTGAILSGIANIIDSTTGALGLFFGQPQDQQEQEVIVVPGEERKDRINTMTIIIGVVVVGLIIGGIVYFVRKKKK